MKVVLTDRAKSDLKNIEGYLVRRNASASVRVIDDVLRAAELLSQHPLIGNEYQRTIRRIFPTRYPSYGIYYRIKHDKKAGESVEVLTIRHTSRIPPIFNSL